MAEIKWTESQKDVFRIHDTNILVAAGAGSGKTTVLIERIIRSIINASNPVDVDKLLVVTFTSAAASEMKNRLATALRNELVTNPDNSHMLRQLALLERSQICTLHSFCLDLVKRYYYYLDLDPDSKIANETDLYVLQESVLDELFENAYARENSGLKLLLKHYARGIDDRVVKDMILQAVSTANSLPDPKGWFDELKKTYDNVDINNWLNYIVSEAINEVNYYLEQYDSIIKISESEINGLTKYCDVLLDEKNQITKFAEILNNYQNENHWDSCVLASQSIEFISLPSITKKMPHDLQLKQQIQDVRNAVKKSIADISTKFFYDSYENIKESIIYLQPVCSAFVELCIDFMDLWKAKKRAKCYLDFSDLEHMALELLQIEEVSNTLKNDFAEVYVDEYQDINRVQEAILDAVSKPNNRFMVGDIKQSIYRFRMAEPQLFNEKFIDYGNGLGGQRVDLMDNFRSQKNIINCINYLFRRILCGKQLEISYDKDAELNPGNDTLPELPVELLLLDKESVDANLDAMFDEEDPISEMKKAEKEAMVMAERIHSEIKDGKNYKDICILLRSAKNTSLVIKDVLEKSGIPAMSDGERDFFDTAEIEIMISLLKIIDNPLQDIEMASVLHSPVVGLSLSELAELRLLAPDASLYDAVLVSDNIKIIAFSQMLEDFRDPTNIMGMKEYCNRVMVKSGLLGAMTCCSNGGQRYENLMEFLNVALEYDNTSFKGLYRFLCYLDWLRLKGKGIRKQSATSDKVNIMTIHRSKGLEYPVVIIGSLDKKFNKMDLNNDFVLHRSLGLGFRAVEPEKRIKYKTIGFNAISMKMDWQLKAEELRLLYVAMTRAKEKLILVGSVDSEESIYKKCDEALSYNSLQIPPFIIKKANNYLNWLLVGLSAHRDCGILRTESNLDLPAEIINDQSKWQVEIIKELPLEIVNGAENIDTIEEDMKSFNKKIADIEVTNEVRDALSWEYKHKDIALWPIKWSATSLSNLKDSVKMDDFDKVEKGNISHRDLSWYADFGTCVHFLLEKADLERISQGEDPHAILKELLNNYDCDEDIKSAVELDKLAGFYKSDIGTDLLKVYSSDGIIRKEADFTLALNLEDFAKVFYNCNDVLEEHIVEFSELYNLDYRINRNEKVFFQGVIDLCFLTDEGWVLVDYKSGRNDHLSDSDVIDKYGSQLKLYQIALEKITGKSVLKKCIYYTANNRLVYM